MRTVYRARDPDKLNINTKPIKRRSNPNAPKGIRLIQSYPVKSTSQQNARSRVKVANEIKVRGERVYKGGTALDQLNETFEDKTLHPTKGFRKINLKRSRAEQVISEIRQGFVSPIDVKTIRKALNDGKDPREAKAEDEGPDLRRI